MSLPANGLTFGSVICTEVPVSFVVAALRFSSPNVSNIPSVFCVSLSSDLNCNPLMSVAGVFAGDDYAGLLCKLSSPVLLLITKSC